ncbi:hypothetical protein TEQG_01409 [Trichophyton equinum CBS 127.97]|uniref:Transcription regulator Rua1 C-terminal domain-containing protein n=1 Tax=Trichophyton equinum (strain ATCC MYA-4606 / CBS 127.97) TaxID=559882 RepID=F2PKF2_TRIEC|nr:hypothetical protein TEQG_01409 [Trichophyton equinum CBS 127.97]
MSTGEVEYRSVLQQSEYISSSQALSEDVGRHIARYDGIPVGHDGGMHPSEYPWTCLPVPVKQETHHARQLYDSIYSLPLMSSPPKYQPHLTYDTNESDQTPLTQRFGISDGYVGANPLHNDMYKAGMVDNHALLPSVGPELNNRASTEAESLSSWENSPRPTMAQLTVDTAVPTTQPPSGFVSASIGYNDVSAYSDMPSSTSAFTPCSSLYYSNTPLSPSASPQRQQQYSNCLKVESGAMAAVSPGAPRTRQLRTYGYDGCGSGWVQSPSSANPTYLPQPHGNTPFAGSSPLEQKPDHYPAPHAVDTSEEKAGSKEAVEALPPPLPKPPAGAKKSESGLAIPKRKIKQAVSRKASGKKLCREQHDIDHYSDLADPPDLFEPLKNSPSQPPPEDLFPSDPTMIPREQDPRFEGDMYTPAWVRGQGNKREGWCGICKPGRWLVLKNSGYWYDKSFTHGISATTGQAFSPPKRTRRSQGNANIWEGLCENCGSWVGLVSSKRRGTTWFRHAYKCYNGCSTTSKSSRAEGTLKRRRANSESDDSRPSTRPKLSSTPTARKTKPAIPSFASKVTS